MDTLRAAGCSGQRTMHAWSVAGSQPGTSPAKWLARFAHQHLLNLLHVI